MVRFWIQKAIKHPGELRAWADNLGFIKDDGTIDLEKSEAYVRKHKLKHRLRSILLARTLGRLRRRVGRL